MQADLHSERRHAMKQLDHETIIATTPSRAGELGNPSDGYGGKALAVSLYNFEATVRIDPADGFHLAPGTPFDVTELALQAEVEDLGIAADSMDRVIQPYEGCPAMELREPNCAHSQRRPERDLQRLPRAGIFVRDAEALGE